MTKNKHHTGQGYPKETIISKNNPEDTLTNYHHQTPPQSINSNEYFNGIPFLNKKSRKYISDQYKHATAEGKLRLSLVFNK